MPFKDPEKQRAYMRAYDKAKRELKKLKYENLLFSETKENEPKLIKIEPNVKVLKHNNAERQKAYRQRNQIQKNLLCQCVVFCCKKANCQIASTVFSLRDIAYLCDSCYQNRYLD